MNHSHSRESTRFLGMVSGICIWMASLLLTWSMYWRFFYVLLDEYLERIHTCLHFVYIPLKYCILLDIFATCQLKVEPGRKWNVGRVAYELFHDHFIIWNCIVRSQKWKSYISNKIFKIVRHHCYDIFDHI